MSLPLSSVWPAINAFTNYRAEVFSSYEGLFRVPVKENRACGGRVAGMLRNEGLRFAGHGVAPVRRKPMTPAISVARPEELAANGNPLRPAKTDDFKQAMARP